MKLWLDDRRPIPSGWRRTHTSEGAIELLNTGQVEEITLSNDGDGNIQVAREILRYISDNKHLLPIIISIHNADTRFTEKYDNEINSLILWFKAALNSVDTFQITKQQYQYGVESLPTHLRIICDDAFHVWLTHRQYELSYNQMCVAFFTAALATNKIEIIGG